MQPGAAEITETPAEKTRTRVFALRKYHGPPAHVRLIRRCRTVLRATPHERTLLPHNRQNCDPKPQRSLNSRGDNDLYRYGYSGVRAIPGNGGGPKVCRVRLAGRNPHPTERSHPRDFSPATGRTQLTRACCFHRRRRAISPIPPSASSPRLVGSGVDETTLSTPLPVIHDSPVPPVLALAEL